MSVDLEVKSWTGKLNPRPSTASFHWMRSLVAIVHHPAGIDAKALLYWQKQSADLSQRHSQPFGNVVQASLPKMTELIINCSTHDRHWDYLCLSTSWCPNEWDHQWGLLLDVHFKLNPVGRTDRLASFPISWLKCYLACVSMCANESQCLFSFLNVFFSPFPTSKTNGVGRVLFKGFSVLRCKPYLFMFTCASSFSRLCYITSRTLWAVQGTE